MGKASKKSRKSKGNSSNSNQPKVKASSRSRNRQGSTRATTNGTDSSLAPDSGIASTPGSCIMAVRNKVKLLRSKFGDGQHWFVKCKNAAGCHDRARVCTYLGFRDTTEMRAWETSDVKRSQYLDFWKDLNWQLDLKTTVILPIVCNWGGGPAKILSWLESQTAWQSLPEEGLEYAAGILRDHIRSNKFEGLLKSIINMSATVVWLLHSCKAQFPDSGHFGTDKFWYCPEDVNRAVWYLRTLRNCRYKLDTAPVQIGKQLKFASHRSHRDTDVLYSISLDDDGTVLSHQVARENVMLKNMVQASLAVPNKYGVVPVLTSVALPVSTEDMPSIPPPAIKRQLRDRGKHRHTREHQPGEMEQRLFELRKWVQDTLPFTDAFPEMDKFFGAAQIHITSGDAAEFNLACAKIRAYAWYQTLPEVVEEEQVQMLKQLRSVQAWLYNLLRGQIPFEKDEILLDEAMDAVRHNNRREFDRARAEIWKANADWETEEF